MTDNLIKTTDHINRQLVDRTDSISTARVANMHIKTLPDTIVISSGNVDGSTLYWDNPVVGFWDDYYWGDDSANTLTAIRVINTNNTFIERFQHTDFIDTSNTTATVTIGTGCSFTTGQILQTEIYAANNITYTSATITMEGVDTSNLSTTSIISSTGIYSIFTATGNVTLSKFYITYN